MTSTVSFDGQVAVVTGAGRGLGKTYAVELARRGAQVVVNDLGGASDGSGSAATAAQETVAEIVATGGLAVADAHSVASREGGEAIIATALDTFGRVDIVINNAGILRDRSFANLDENELNQILDVHLRGAFFVTQPAFRHMKQQGYGRLLFTSSGSGLFGNFGQTNYGAAKAGLLGLSNVLAIEGGKAGVTSNVIVPVARTRLTADLFGPLGEALDPEFLTPLAVYLVSRDCTLTHQVFMAGAGWYSKVFLGVTPGWFVEKGVPPCVEDIAEHLSEIELEESYTVPSDGEKAIAPIMNVLA